MQSESKTEPQAGVLLCDTSFPPNRVPLNVTETQRQELEQSWGGGKYALALLVSARASNLCQ